MVITVIVSFFQLFDNHDYILKLAFFYNNENQGYEPYKLLWFCSCSYNYSTLVLNVWTKSMHRLEFHIHAKT
jgi:hypothetical protein